MAWHWDSETPVVRHSLAALGVLVLMAVALEPAAAAEWGGIAPGTTSMATVRARHGTATRTSTGKVEGYDTVQWVYEGAQAPVGMKRMVVDFGLLLPAGYRADVVRTFRLEPKPGIFPRNMVVQGWGAPTAMREEAGALVFFYREGLFVYFDGEGRDAHTLMFTVPQLLEGRPAVPTR